MVLRVPRGGLRGTLPQRKGLQLQPMAGCMFVQQTWGGAGGEDASSRAAVSADSRKAEGTWRAGGETPGNTHTGRSSGTGPATAGEVGARGKP